MGVGAAIAAGIGGAIIGGIVGGAAIKSSMDRSARQSSRAISDHDSYDPESASRAEAEKINNDLVDFRSNIEKDAKKLEKECSQKCTEQLSSFISELEKINNKSYDGHKLNLNIGSLRQSLDYIKRNINCHIQNKVLKSVSTDDSECLRILKLSSGREKEREMYKFQKHIINSSLNELSDLVRETVNDSVENIENSIKNRMKEIEFSIKKKRNDFRDIENIMSSDGSEMESKCCELNLEIALYDYVDNIIK